MEINERAKKYDDFINMQRYLEPKYSFPLATGLIALTSIGMYFTFKKQNCYTSFKQALRTSYSLKTLNEKTLYNRLVYANEKIVRSNVVLAKDSLLNMTSSDIDKLGLYRKVEIYQKQKLFRREKWANINILTDTQQVSTNTEIRSEVSPNGMITVNNHYLTNPLLIQLADQYSFKRTLDEQKMQNLFMDLEMSKTNTKIQNSNNEKSDLSKNPLFKLAQEGKRFSVKDDYIYIQQSGDALSDGDIRISFYDVKNIAEEVTLLAAKNENNFCQFEPEDIVNKSLTVQFKQNSDQKPRELNISLFNFITSGQITQEELIRKLVNLSNKDTFKDTLLYSLIIFSLYLYINTYLIQQFISSDETYNEVKVEQIANIIAHKEELPDSITDDKRLKSSLFYSFVDSSVNIGLLKILSKGFVMTTIWLGGWAALLLYNQYEETFTMGKKIKEKIPQFENEQTKEGKQLQEQNAFIQLFNKFK